MDVHHVLRFNRHSPQKLVGGLVAINLAFSQKYWEFLIIPIDELMFFRGVAQPPTRKCSWRIVDSWHVLSPVAPLLRAESVGVLSLSGKTSWISYYDISQITTIK